MYCCTPFYCLHTQTQGKGNCMSYIPIKDKGMNYEFIGYLSKETPNV